MQLILKIYLGIIYLLSEVSRLTDSFNCDICHDVDRCDTVRKTFRVTNLGRGYHPVVTLPRGACGINVTELGHSNNVLALKDVRRNDNIINGLWSMDNAGDYEGAGVTFYYRKSEGSCPGECVTARGPLLSQVLVQLLYHEENKGVFYTYKLPKHFKPDSQDYEHATARPSTSDRSELREGEIGYQPIPETETESEADKNEDKHPVFPPRVPIPGPGSIRHRGPVFSSDFSHRWRTSSRLNYNRVRGKENNRQRQALTDVTFSRGMDDDTYRQENVETGVYVNNGTDEGSGDGVISVLEEYIWRSTENTECSRPCGGGIQEYSYECVNTTTLAIVDESNCDSSVKPEVQFSVCNAEPCTPQWDTGEWSECSVTCGEGMQYRNVTCQQRISATYTQQLDDGYCTSSKPVQRKECYLRTCYSWVKGDWSECSVDCGIGIRRRNVQCLDDTGMVADKTFCDQSEPEANISCDMGACATHWYFSQWNGKCSRDCGTGVISRNVHCATSTGQILPDVSCDGTSKPAAEKQCRIDSECGGKWFSGPWSQCSRSCGLGEKSRQVVCMVSMGSRLVPSAKSNCNAGDKPRERKECTEAECGFTWYTTEWSSCSHSCGGGESTRSVKCYDDKMEPSSMCHEDDKPENRQTCNTDECWTPRPRTSTGCVDMYPNCDVVVQARLCRYPYYQRKCCISCSAVDGLYISYPRL
ncbi:thrombospondin type-1 domain-containing protein 4-like isoform X1 [Mercenaria mercenaria]|uniref:thrombospondin type-1 domain-containing protein 4-like isoform X1 n=1 Tax=Mercenaria mercenaria TaxID=6596 RepID=UPI00234FA966|nr:thrombospondin type-1 domain-containing protein 4-like isoform X1 [Mercenaria mercenaria]